MSLRRSKSTMRSLCMTGSGSLSDSAKARSASRPPTSGRRCSTIGRITSRTVRVARSLASSTGVAKGNETDRLAFLDHVPGRLSGAKQVLVHDRFRCQVGRNDVEICSHHVPDDELGYAAEDKERDPRHWDTAQLGGYRVGELMREERRKEQEAGGKCRAPRQRGSPGGMPSRNFLVSLGRKHPQTQLNAPLHGFHARSARLAPYRESTQ